MKKNLAILILLLIFTTISKAQTDNELKVLFGNFVETENAGSSIVMVEVSEKGTRFVNFGKLSKDNLSANADENTIYEIGSLTKLFTGTLLAEAINRGEVKLDDPISKHLPKSVKSPSFNGKEITLLDLATHSANLPEMPDNINQKGDEDPFANYTVQNLYDFLSSYKMPAETGKTYRYSNLGIGLLGHILSLKAKMTFEQLVAKRVLKPLKMNDTFLTLPASKKLRHAQGLNMLNNPTPNLVLQALQGAGAIRSTTGDMAKFIAANLGFTKTSISKSLDDAMQMQRPANNSIRIGFCWHSIELLGTNILFHSGKTNGFTSSISIAPTKKKGMFIVTNSGSSSPSRLLESISFNSIDERFPIAKPKKKPLEITLPEGILKSYVGEYQVTPQFSLLVTVEGTRIFTQATNQQKFEIFAEKEDEFFLKEVEAKLSFEKDESGNIIRVILRQNGNNIPAKKIK